jgi:hypothetical protein
MLGPDPSRVGGIAVATAFVMPLSHKLRFVAFDWKWMKRKKGLFSFA